MDLAALQLALDQARATGDLAPLHEALRAQGWKPRYVPKPATQAEILARVQVDPVTDCWEWTKKLDNGYGAFKNMGAHRASWEAFNGPIPEGLHLDHVCRNRACVNPTTTPPLHLEPVTRDENDRRARAYVQQHPGEQVHHAAKKWCKRGHAFDDVNTGIDRLGKRYCKACRHDYVRQWRAKKKAAALQ